MINYVSTNHRSTTLLQVHNMLYISARHMYVLYCAKKTGVDKINYKLHFIVLIYIKM